MGQIVGAFEELVLLAIRELQITKHADGPTVMARLDEAGRHTSEGALYTTLHRLEQKQLLISSELPARPQRGGRRRRFYTITTAGREALKEAESTRRYIQGTL